MRDRGLSMIEVVVAMMVFAVGICSAVSVGYVASHWGTKARQEMEAGRLARALFDYARRAENPVQATTFYSHERVPTASPPPAVPFEFTSPVQFVWKVEVQSADSLGLYPVTITISRDTNGDGVFDPYDPVTESGDETVAVFNALIR